MAALIIGLVRITFALCKLAFVLSALVLSLAFRLIKLVVVLAARAISAIVEVIKRKKASA